MGRRTCFNSLNSSFSLLVLLIALALTSNPRTHVVARNLIEMNLPDDFPENPDPFVPDDDPDYPVDENPVPVTPDILMLPQPDLPEFPDLPDLLPSPALPLPTFPTISAQEVSTRP